MHRLNKPTGLFSLVLVLWVAALPDLQATEGPRQWSEAHMDALPVIEQTGLPFASRVHTVNVDGGKVGVMHACGHDVHMTNLIGEACYLAAIQHKAQAVANGAGAPVPLVEIARGTPALFNDPELSARLRPAFQNQIGGENVVLSKQTMGGEDFSRYRKAGVPILMYWLGAVSQEHLDEYKAAGEQLPSLHSHLFYPDVNAALITGVSTMSSAVLELLKP